MEIASIVLAGGRGLRLGCERALETAGDQSLRPGAVFPPGLFNSNLIIATAARQFLPRFIGYPKLKVVTDAYPAKGRLGGIDTGLAASEPFDNRVVPGLGNIVEPLHAVCSKSCLAAIESLLEQGNLSVRGLFASVRVRYLAATEINRFDPGQLSFFNINTETDLETAREVAGGDMSDDKC